MPLPTLPLGEPTSVDGEKELEHLAEDIMITSVLAADVKPWGSVNNSRDEKTEGETNMLLPLSRPRKSTTANAVWGARSSSLELYYSQCNKGVLRHSTDGLVGTPAPGERG